MSIVEGKVWGTTIPLIQRPQLDTKALEIYWSELSLNDIEREIVGGIDQTLDLFNPPLKDDFGKVFNLDDLEGKN